jgi:hypothetical protein
MNKRGDPATSPEADFERAAAVFLTLDEWRARKTDPISSPSRAKSLGELGMGDSLYRLIQVLDKKLASTSSGAPPLPLLSRFWKATH